MNPRTLGWTVDWQRRYTGIRALLDAGASLDEIMPGVTWPGDDIGRWLTRQIRDWAQPNEEERKKAAAGLGGRETGCTAPEDGCTWRPDWGREGLRRLHTGRSSPPAIHPAGGKDRGRNAARGRAPGRHPRTRVGARFGTLVVLCAFRAVHGQIGAAGQKLLPLSVV
ncbi:hypothetical protein GCM10018966_069050 [Streptomyces yanii]